MHRISRYVFTTVAALSAIGLGEANATALPSVIGPATVANLTFGANIVSDGIRVFNPDGSFLTGFGKTDAQESNCGIPAENAQGPGEHTLGGCLFAFNPAQMSAAPADLSLAGQLTLVFEPDGVTLSDIFGVDCFTNDPTTGACTSGALAYLSKINGLPLDLAALGDTSNFFKVTEIAGGPGTVFDMTYYLAPSLRDAGYTARFLSANDAVPEPSTLALFGAGFAGVIAMRRRRKANKAV